jgi:hypothetical protein
LTTSDVGKIYKIRNYDFYGVFVSIAMLLTMTFWAANPAGGAKSIILYTKPPIREGYEVVVQEKA